MKRLLALVMTALVCGAAAPSTPDRAIDSYLRGLSRQGLFSGNVLVVQDGKTRFEKSYGWASWELRVPNNPETRFRIHSVSKRLIATAVLQLVQAGKLSLDDSVVSVLPQLPQAWQGATVRELMNHTSGIPADEDLWATHFMESPARTQLANLDAIAAKLQDQKLVSAPGSTWKYNNFGYDLLGCIIEKRSGQSLDAYMHDRIFQPAGMVDSLMQSTQPVDHSMYTNDAVVPHLASGYNGAAKNMETADPQMYASAGAGGVVSSAEDLCRYDRALDDGTLLSPNLESEAETDTVAASKSMSYGLGWMSVKTKGGQTYLHHSGGNNGYMAEYVRVPQRHVCIAVVSNYGFAPIGDMRNNVLELLLGTDFAPVAP